MGLVSLCLQEHVCVGNVIPRLLLPGTVPQASNISAFSDILKPDSSSSANEIRRSAADGTSESASYTPDVDLPEGKNYNTTIFNS